MAIRFEWSPLVVDDAEALFNAQNEFVEEHYDLTKPHSNTTFDKWKTVLGYPQDDTKRLEFIRNMANGTTKHGKSLHCLKLTRYEDEKATTAGFIDFEVRQISDKNLKSNVREIYIRSVIVYSHLRRQGCGRKLYHALFQYLSPGDLDVIRLYVVDLNQAAICFYFKLGFKITQWFFRELGEDTKTDPCFKAVFLCMQKLQGERVDSGKHAIALQDMPHLFAEQVVGEIVHVDCENGASEWTQCARIEKYDAKHDTFSIAHRDLEDAENGGESLVPDLCVNDLFACGRLSFDTPPSIFLNKGLTPCCQMITKVNMAEPSRWPKSGLVHTPEKTKNTNGPRKRVAWPVSAVSPSGKKSILDDSKKTDLGPGNGVLCIFAPPKPTVPRNRREVKEVCEYGYEDGTWCKGGVIDFLLKTPAGQQIRVGGYHRISFKQENPKQAGTEAFKSYNRYKKASTVFEFCQLNGKARKRVQVLRDLKHDVQWGHAKCGKNAARNDLPQAPKSCKAKPKASGARRDTQGEWILKANGSSTVARRSSAAKKQGSARTIAPRQPSTLVKSMRKRANAEQSGGPSKLLRSRSGARVSSSSSGSRSGSRRPVGKCMGCK